MKKIAIIANLSLALKNAEMHRDAAFDRIRDESYFKGRKDGQANLAETIKNKDFWYDAAKAELDSLSADRKELQDKLAMTAQAMQEIDIRLTAELERNDKLDKYWNEREEQQIAVVARLNVENAKLRSEDEDSISLIVELRSALATAHKRAEKYETLYNNVAPVTRGRCRNMRGSGPVCNCEAGKCIYGHEDLPF